MKAPNPAKLPYDSSFFWGLNLLYPPELSRSNWPGLKTYLQILAKPERSPL
ncbi:MAG: hypothetical protein HC890_07935 [Chloroflexaceae bacterium]|nr:hypothetical protein [Chloroflexaceae bacterium]